MTEAQFAALKAWVKAEADAAVRNYQDNLDFAKAAEAIARKALVEGE